MSYQYSNHPRLGPIITANHHGCGNHIDLQILLGTISGDDAFGNKPGATPADRSQIVFTGRENNQISLEYGLGVLRPVGDYSDHILEELAATLNNLEH